MTGSFPLKIAPQTAAKGVFRPKMNIPGLKMIFKVLPVAFPVVCW
jgi:hypothetical protein